MLRSMSNVEVNCRISNVEFKMYKHLEFTMKNTARQTIASQDSTNESLWVISMNNYCLNFILQSDYIHCMFVLFQMHDT